jgi:outer membrane murein-binding lipoprotein Lpp
MEDRTLVACAPAGKVMPATRAECRAAIDQLRGDIDAIRAQIAAADLERQASRGKMDPRWYHRARTAIRHKRQQIAALAAHLHSLPADPGRKAGFKDCLIEVLRHEFDEEAWQRFLDRAHSLHEQREAA